MLEVTARAITYYLDVSAECTRRIVAVDGAIKALCNRLVVAEMSSRTSKDLAEQCIKVTFYYLLIIKSSFFPVMCHSPKKMQTIHFWDPGIMLFDKKMFQAKQLKEFFCIFLFGAFKFFF